MTIKIKLPCGIDKDGKVIYIEDAKNGLKCECRCPACMQLLIAKNGGKKRKPHFAHLNTVECEHGYQSALHYMAKDIFMELEYLAFIKNGQPIRYKIDSVELEYKVNEIIPDIMITCDGRKYIVEIYVTHAVDDIKKQKIQDMRISAIEIDLSKYTRDNLTKEELKEELCKTENFRWVYDADNDLINDKKEIIEKFGFKIPLENTINCPKLNKSIFFGVCYHCPDCSWNERSNYFRCAHFFPRVLNTETRAKLNSAVFIKSKKVMFESELQKFEISFIKIANAVIKNQIEMIIKQKILQSIASNLYYSSSTAYTKPHNPSKHNYGKNQYHNNNRKRRY